EAPRSLDRRSRLRENRGGLVRVLRTNLLRPPVRTKNDQGKDRRGSQVPREGRDGRDGGPRPRSLKIRQTSIRTLHRSHVCSHHPGRALQPSQENDRLQPPTPNLKNARL